MRGHRVVGAHGLLRHVHRQARRRCRRILDAFEARTGLHPEQPDSQRRVYPPQGEDLEGWIRSGTEHPGSWWIDWIAWIKAQDADEVPAREPGGGKLTPIEDAPGSYVKVRLS